jgi:hypothetical protein
VRRDSHEAAVARFLHAYLPRRPNDPRWPWLAERDALNDYIAQLEGRLAESERQREQAAVQLEQTRGDLRAAERSLAVIKRSRLLKLGRWLRRIRGMPQPY